MKLIKKETNTIIAEKVIVAESFWQRLCGLLGRTTLRSNETMWIQRCDSIHTFFMKFPIDVVFVDKKLKVCSVKTNIKPWRLATSYWCANSVFEFASPNSEVQNLRKGDLLYVGN
ncbi:MAG: DUF192 domain-containing protein [Pseudomonadota bacterium]|nr:DUF192 domain-containing protein [Pseudomonadota bacterium]